MTHHEHHFRNLQRSRDHLTNTIQALKSATELMTGDDWIEATYLLGALQYFAPRLSQLRANAEDRFDEWSRHPEFERMRTGEIPFPDERVTDCDGSGTCSATTHIFGCFKSRAADEGPMCLACEGTGELVSLAAQAGDQSHYEYIDCPDCGGSGVCPFPPPLNGPNAQEGERLAHKHGSVDEAMRHYQPDSAEMDHLQAYRYVPPGGWCTCRKECGDTDVDGPGTCKKGSAFFSGDAVGEDRPRQALAGLPERQDPS